MGSTVQFPRVIRRQAKVTGREGSDLPSVVGFPHCESPGKSAAGRTEGRKLRESWTLGLTVGCGFARRPFSYLGKSDGPVCRGGEGRRVCFATPWRQNGRARAYCVVGEPSLRWYETGRPTNGGWSFCPVPPFPRTVSVEEDSHLRIGNSTLDTGRIANFARWDPAKSCRCRVWRRLRLHRTTAFGNTLSATPHTSQRIEGKRITPQRDLT